MDTLVVGMREGLGRGWDGRGIERSKVGRLEGREGRKRNREEERERYGLIHEGWVGSKDTWRGGREVGMEGGREGMEAG